MYISIYATKIIMGKNLLSPKLVIPMNKLGWHFYELRDELKEFDRVVALPQLAKILENTSKNTVKIRFKKYSVDINYIKEYLIILSREVEQNRLKSERYDFN